MNENQSASRQTTIMLSYFQYEIPVIYLEDETPYIPVVELCKMLGLHADTYIPQWRKLVLWSSARKLPYQTPARGRRIVWCLHRGALLFWFSCFDWSHVLPERRAQLKEASYEGMSALDQVHQEMQTRYKEFRRHLFEFLTAYSHIETTLPRFSASFYTYLDDFDVCIAWEDLISQGKALIDETILHARGVLQDQARLPVIDAVSIDTHGQVIEELALPLFPIVDKKDTIRFFENLGKIAEWHQQIMNFLGDHRFTWDKEQKKWYRA